MNKKDWLLLIIAAANGDTLTPVQLQKSAFLLSKSPKVVVGDDYYEFVPYAYGPFCVDIYNDTRELEIEGLIAIQPSRTGHWSEYRATQEGLQRAKELEESIPQDVQVINKYVSWARQQSFRSLLRQIYKKFPTYSENSVFQG